MPETTGSTIIAGITALGTFVGAFLGGVTKVKSLTKADKNNAAEIAIVGTRVGAVEKRIAEEIKAREVTHSKLSDSVFELRASNDLEHEKMREKMNEIARSQAASQATMHMMNENLQRLLSKGE